MTSTSGAGGVLALPAHRGIYYGGDWHEPSAGRYDETLNPGTGESLGRVAVAGDATWTPQ